MPNAENKPENNPKDNKIWILFNNEVVQKLTKYAYSELDPPCPKRFIKRIITLNKVEFDKGKFQSVQAITWMTLLSTGEWIEIERPVVALYKIGIDSYYSLSKDYQS